MKRLGLVMALLIGATSLQAQATTQASVQIGAPVIKVVDLDLHDGIAAAYAEGGPWVQSFSDLLRPASVESFAEGRARIVRDEVNGIAGVTDGPGSFLVVGDRYAPSSTFTVAAHSRITVSTDYSLQATMAGEGRNGDDAAHALASMDLTLVAVGNLSFDDWGDYRYDILAADTAADRLDTPSSPSFADGVGPRQGTLSLSFDNLTDADAVFAFRGEMLVFGRSPVTPVPEPQTYALMLLGLAAVAAQVRRKR